MVEHPKFCPHCGTPVVDKMRFCVSCGKAVVVLAPTAPAPAAPAQAEPKKRPPIWGYIAVTFALLFGCYFVFAVIPAGVRSSASAAKTYTVTYRVGGSTPYVDVTYQNSGGDAEQKSRVQVPWSKVITARTGQFVYISAQNQISSGTVTCQILVDGQVVKESESSGGYTIATCSGSI